MPNGDTYTIKEFANIVRNKYNSYEDISDDVLVEKWMKKYPEYKDRISDKPEEVVVEEETVDMNKYEDPVFGKQESRFGEVDSGFGAAFKSSLQSNTQQPLNEGTIPASASEKNKERKNQIEEDHKQAIVELESDYKKKSIDYGGSGDEIATQLYGEFLQKKKEFSYEDHLQKEIDNIGVDAKNDVELNKIKKGVLEGKLSKAEARMNLMDIGRKDLLNLPMFKIEDKQDDDTGSERLEIIKHDGPKYVGGTAIADLGTYIIDAAFHPNIIEGDAKAETTDPSRKFNGVVSADGKLVNWNTYYDDESKIGIESEEILEQQPGSYIVNDVESLNRYAEENNLSHDEALAKINENARSFNAHQKLAEQQVWERGGMSAEDAKAVSFTVGGDKTLALSRKQAGLSSKRPLLTAAEKDQLSVEEGVLKQLVDSRIKQAVTKLPTAIESGEYKNYFTNLVRDFSEEDIERAKVRSQATVDVDVSEYGLDDLEEDTKTEQVYKEIDKGIEDLGEYFKDEEGTSRIQSYINKYVNKGLDVVEGWTEEQPNKR